MAFIRNPTKLNLRQERRRVQGDARRGSDLDGTSVVVTKGRALGFILTLGEAVDTRVTRYASLRASTG